MTAHNHGYQELPPNADTVRTFVWTDTGTRIHVTRDPVTRYTFCGRPARDQADAFDVLWFQVCDKCKRACIAIGGLVA